MLKAYALQQNALRPVLEEALHQRPDRLVWIDLLSPSRQEETTVEELLGIEIPTRDEMHEIELSSRLYQENGALYATASVITKAETPEPEIHAISFVLVKDCLVTVRYSEPKPFKLFAEWSQRESDSHCHGNTILAGLVEAIIDRLADVLESIGHEVDDVARKLFRPAVTDKEKRSETRPDFEEMLQRIAISSDRASKARESLVSLTRLLTFVSQTPYFKHGSDEHRRVEVMQRDIASLSDHASFLANKVSFLLDATLGMIGIEQSGIIKIFSVAAVVFLPPTLVASIYGMNFDFMPELDWKLGYPLAILLMILSAWMPYRFFKKKGWL